MRLVIGIVSVVSPVFFGLGITGVKCGLLSTPRARGLAKIPLWDDYLLKTLVLEAALCSLAGEKASVRLRPCGRSTNRQTRRGKYGTEWRDQIGLK